MNKVTEIVFILDRSGSMGGLEADTVGGFNSMLAKQQEEEGDAYVSTVLFDNEIDVIHDRLPIAEVPQLTAREYFVRGSTALLDAVGGAIRHIANVHKYARREDVPEKTLFIITTDGMENASTRYTYERVKQMVKKQKARGWEFLFLGANIDAIEAAGQFGIGAGHAVNYRADARGTTLNFMAMSEAIRCVRVCEEPLSADWKKGIEEDVRRRGRS